MDILKNTGNGTFKTVHSFNIDSQQPSDTLVDEFKNQKIDLQFNVSMITNAICDITEYVLKKLTCIDKIIFRFDNTDCTNYDTLIKIIHILAGSKKIVLDTIDNLEIFESFTAINTVKIFLRNIKCEKLYLFTNFQITDELSDIINSNPDIQSIYLEGSLRFLNLSDGVTINCLHHVLVDGTFGLVEKFDIKTLFKTAPNLSKLCFNGVIVNKYSNPLFIKDVIKTIINLIIQKQQFDKLGFTKCELDNEDINYICSCLIGYNLRKFILFDPYSYKNLNIDVVINMLKSCVFLKQFEIYNIDLNNALLIIEQLTNSNIKKFATVIKIDNSKEHKNVEKKICKILSENYSLTNINVNISSKSKCWDVDATSVTERNIKINSEIRYTKTKPVHE